MVLFPARGRGLRMLKAQATAHVTAVDSLLIFDARPAQGCAALVYIARVVLPVGTHSLLATAAMTAKIFSVGPGSALKLPVAGWCDEEDTRRRQRRLGVVPADRDARNVQRTRRGQNVLTFRGRSTLLFSE